MNDIRSTETCFNSASVKSSLINDDSAMRYPMFSFNNIHFNAKLHCFLSSACKTGLAPEKVCTHMPNAPLFSSCHHPAGPSANIFIQTRGNTHKHVGLDKLESLYRYLVEKA